MGDLVWVFTVTLDGDTEVLAILPSQKIAMAQMEEYVVEAIVDTKAEGNPSVGVHRTEKWQDNTVTIGDMVWKTTAIMPSKG